jgi:hypothetical protein
MDGDNEHQLHRGDLQFAAGVWAFCVGFAIITVDVRDTLVRIARASGQDVPRYDASFYLLSAYVLCLALFGVASTLYILPGKSLEIAATALLVVSNAAFTLMNIVALWFLWKEFSSRTEIEVPDFERGVAADVVTGAPADNGTRLARRLSFVEGDRQLARTSSGGMDLTNALRLTGMMGPQVRERQSADGTVTITPRISVMPRITRRSAAADEVASNSVRMPPLALLPANPSPPTGADDAVPARPPSPRRSSVMREVELPAAVAEAAARRHVRSLSREEVH